MLEQIIQSTTPVACNNLGKTVKNCDKEKWNEATSELCYPEWLEKLKQNPGLAAFLKNTGNKTILECCYDDVWGNGVPLTNPKCIDPGNYKQQGILGEMLERIRMDLNTPQATSTQLVSETKIMDTNCDPMSSAKSELPVQM